MIKPIVKFAAIQAAAVTIGYVDAAVIDYIASKIKNPGVITHIVRWNMEMFTSGKWIIGSFAIPVLVFTLFVMWYDRQPVEVAADPYAGLFEHEDLSHADVYPYNVRAVEGDECKRCGIPRSICICD